MQMISSLLPVFCFILGLATGWYMHGIPKNKEVPSKPQKPNYKPPDPATIVQLKSAEDLLEEKLKNEKEENENI